MSIGCWGRGWFIIRFCGSINGGWGGMGVWGFCVLLLLLLGLEAWLGWQMCREYITWFFMTGLCRLVQKCHHIYPCIWVILLSDLMRKSVEDGAEARPRSLPVTHA